MFRYILHHAAVFDTYCFAELMTSLFGHGETIAQMTGNDDRQMIRHSMAYDIYTNRKFELKVKHITI